MKYFWEIETGEYFVLNTLHHGIVKCRKMEHGGIEKNTVAFIPEIPGGNTGELAVLHLDDDDLVFQKEKKMETKEAYKNQWLGVVVFFGSYFLVILVILFH